MTISSTLCWTKEEVKKARLASLVRTCLKIQKKKKKKVKLNENNWGHCSANRIPSRHSQVCISNPQLCVDRQTNG